MLREVRISGVPVEVRAFRDAEDLLDLTPIKRRLTILLPEEEVTCATLAPERCMFPGAVLLFRAARIGKPA